MKYSLRLSANSGARNLTLIVLSVLLLFATPANAADFQCKLIESNQFEPLTISSMQDAFNNGHLYRVQVDTSNVSFKVNHFPFSTVEARFREFEGGLALPDEMTKSKQALFIINVASLSTGDNDLNDYLKSSAFFNAEQFPVIVFVSTGFEWINKSTAQLVGNLTLHGKTMPLIFNLTIDATENTDTNNREKLTMQASAEISRSDFGMRNLQMLVSDKVKFSLKIEALRMPG